MNELNFMEIYSQNKSNQQNLKQTTLQTILRNLNGDQFIDCQFKHSYESIYDKFIQPQRMQQIIWIPCEQLHHKPMYSPNDVSLKFIQKINFQSTCIKPVLIFLKCLIPQSFQKVTKNRQLTYKFKNRQVKHLYQFQVFKDKQKMKQYIDSYIPVSEVRNKQLFTTIHEEYLFPCLIQKLLAKFSGGYQNIQKLRIEQIIQFFSCYPMKKVKVDEFFIENSENVNLIKLNEFIQMRIIQNKDLLFFKTRNNQKLQFFGLKPNKSYLISDLIDDKHIGQKLISFLQISQTNQFKESSNTDAKTQKQYIWIGKYSKFRFQEYQIKSRLCDQLKKYQNFMSLKDLGKITRQFIVLRNTSNSSISTQIFSIESITQTMRKQPQQSEQVKINQNTIRQIKLKQNNGYLISWCEIFNLQFKNVDSNMKFQLNLRLIIDESEPSIIQFNKFTLIIVSSTNSQQIYSHNYVIRSKWKDNQSYFDYLIESDQIQKLKQYNFQNHLHLLIFVDGISSQQSYQRINLILKVTKFEYDKSSNYKPSKLLLGNTSSLLTFKKLLQDKKQYILLYFLKNLMIKDHQTNKQNQITQQQPLQIYCKQFFTELSLGLIYIKFNPSNQQQTKTEQIKISLYHQHLLSNSLHYIQSFSQFVKIAQQTSKQLILKASLNQYNNQLILLFRYYNNNNNNNQINQVLNQNQIYSSKKQFPPKDSIKICKTYQAEV